jgi:ankyrin repeat protein
LPKSVVLEVLRFILLPGKRVNVEAATDMGSTALIFASNRGHSGVVALLLEVGAKMGAKTFEGANPLIMAVVEGHSSTVRLLLEAGAETNEVDNRGISPLMWAAHMGRAEIVRLLLDAGADRTIQNQHQRTARGEAEIKGHVEVVALFDAVL